MSSVGSSRPSSRRPAACCVDRPASVSTSSNWLETGGRHGGRRPVRQRRAGSGRPGTRRYRTRLQVGYGRVVVGDTTADSGRSNGASGLVTEELHQAALDHSRLVRADFGAIVSSSLPSSNRPLSPSASRVRSGTHTATASAETSPSRSVTLASSDRRATRATRCVRSRCPSRSPR